MEIHNVLINFLLPSTLVHVILIKLSSLGHTVIVLFVVGLCFLYIYFVLNIFVEIL